MGKMGEMKQTTQKESSREELKNYINQLQQQNKFLMEQAQKRNSEELFKRIDYLFKVIETPQIFIEIDKEFVKEVAIELISILKVQEEPNQVMSQSEAKEGPCDCGCEAPVA